MFVFSSDQQRPLTTLFRCVVVAVALLLTTGVPNRLHHRTEQWDSSRSVADPPTCNCNSNNVLWQRSFSSLNAHSNSTACVCDCWCCPSEVSSCVVGPADLGGFPNGRGIAKWGSPTYTNPMECAGPSDSTRRDCLVYCFNRIRKLVLLLRFRLHRRIRSSRLTIFILDTQNFFLLMEVASGNLRVPCEYSSINCFQTTADFRARILKRNDVVNIKVTFTFTFTASMWRTTLKSPSS